MNEKKDFLFRFVDPHIRQQLLLDEEALYSTTDQLTADKITRDLLRFIERTATICDGTSCIGGNTYSFAQVFSHVLAYEIDPKRASYLTQNMKSLNMHHVKCYEGDVIQLLRQKVDCIFLDPPWGGPEYKQQHFIQLFLSQQPLSTVCKLLASYTTYFALKVPINFDEATFQKECKGFLSLIHRNTQLRKMHLLVYKVGIHP